MGLLFDAMTKGVSQEVLEAIRRAIQQGKQ